MAVPVAVPPRPEEVPAAMRSPYTLEDPPPLTPPAVVVEVTAWALAADIWHGHHPDTLLGTECVECHAPWPCPSWEVADSILADVCPPRVATGTARPAVPPLRPTPPETAPAPPSAPAPRATDPTLPPETAAGSGRTGRHAVAEDRPAPAQRARRTAGSGEVVPAGTAPGGRRRRRAEPADTGTQHSAERLVGHRRATQELPVLGNLPRAVHAAPESR